MAAWKKPSRPGLISTQTPKPPRDIAGAVYTDLEGAGRVSTVEQWALGQSEINDVRGVLVYRATYTDASRALRPQRESSSKTDARSRISWFSAYHYDAEGLRRRRFAASRSLHPALAARRPISPAHSMISFLVRTRGTPGGCMLGCRQTRQTSELKSPLLRSLMSRCPEAIFGQTAGSVPNRSNAFSLSISSHLPC